MLCVLFICIYVCTYMYVYTYRLRDLVRQRPRVAAREPRVPRVHVPEQYDAYQYIA